MIEEKLARESTKRRQAESQIEGLQQDCDALESQLASKQETMNDLMDETEALEVRHVSVRIIPCVHLAHLQDDLRSTKRSLKGVQDAMVTLQAAHTDALEEVATLKVRRLLLNPERVPSDSVAGPACSSHQVDMPHVRGRRPSRRTSNNKGFTLTPPCRARAAMQRSHRRE